MTYPVYADVHVTLYTGQVTIYKVPVRVHWTSHFLQGTSTCTSWTGHFLQGTMYVYTEQVTFYKVPVFVRGQVIFYKVPVRVQWTSHYLQVTRKTPLCIIGHPVPV